MRQGLETGGLVPLYYGTGKGKTTAAMAWPSGPWDRACG